MKIFISYRRNDSARDVGRIRDRLKREFGEQNVYRDIADIPLGTDFRRVIEQETNGCDVMLVVIGPLWAGITDAQGNKRLFDPGDFTRIEVETGLKRLLEDKAGVIPVFVMDAKMPAPSELPDSLNQLTFQNGIGVHDDPYFDFDMDRLIQAIKKSSRAKTDFEPETIPIPADPFFLMGSSLAQGIPEYEGPQHEVNLPSFRIGSCPVTNGQYAQYLSDKRIPVPRSLGWGGLNLSKSLEDYPVVGVTLYEAAEYCRWLSEKTQRKYSLPNEAQWEKACRGGNNYLYPWGDELEPKRSNHGCESLSPVKAYIAQNDYGCFDMVGNIRQWTRSLWGERRIAPDPEFAYPWKDDRRNVLNENSQLWWVTRGSSYLDDDRLLRCSARDRQLPGERGFPGKRYGFRVARID